MMNNANIYQDIFVFTQYTIPQLLAGKTKVLNLLNRKFDSVSVFISRKDYKAVVNQNSQQTPFLQIQNPSLNSFTDVFVQ